MLAAHRAASATVTAAVARSSPAGRTAYIGGCVFCAWFFGYGLRKPFSAASYRQQNDTEAGAAVPAVLGLAPKDAISMGQTFGYMAGKVVATTAVPRLSRGARLPLRLLEQRPHLLSARVACLGLVRYMLPP